MSVQAIQQEFPTSVEVISWDNPDDQGVVGLVRSGRGWCVIELGTDGTVPLFEDFSADEEIEARNHFDDRCRVMRSRKSRAGSISALFDAVEKNLAQRNDRFLDIDDFFAV